MESFRRPDWILGYSDSGSAICVACVMIDLEKEFEKLRNRRAQQAYDQLGQNLGALFIAGILFLLLFALFIGLAS